MLSFGVFNLAQAFHVDGTIGPFDGPNGWKVRPTFRGHDDEKSNPDHWTITINQHTQGVLEDTIGTCAAEIKGLSPDAAVRILHDSIDAVRPKLTDEYNEHGYSLLDVELKVPDQGFLIHSCDAEAEYLAVSKHNMTFWHTHDPNMAPEAELHSHDVVLTVGIGNDNDATKLSSVVDVCDDMHERLQQAVSLFFATSQNFMNVTMELAAERLFDRILETMPDLQRSAANDYLKQLGIRVIYDGSLDHPDYPVEFTRTLA